MEYITNYHLFVLTALLINITPGADTLYIVSRSVSQGKVAGLLSVMGISSGGIFHTLASAVGLSAVLMTSAYAFTIIKWMGAVYLVYIGLSSLLNSKNTNFEVDDISSISNKKIFIQGFLTNTLNPKVSLFFLALLPQFISEGSPNKTISFLILGFTFISTGTIWCLTVSYVSSLFGNYLKKSKKIGSYLNRISGTILVALGIRLAIQEK